MVWGWLVGKRKVEDTPPMTVDTTPPEIEVTEDEPMSKETNYGLTVSYTTGIKDSNQYEQFSTELTGLSLQEAIKMQEEFMAARKSDSMSAFKFEVTEIEDTDELDGRDYQSLCIPISFVLSVSIQVNNNANLRC